MKRIILFAAILLLPVSALAQKAYEAIWLFRSDRAALFGRNRAALKDVAIIQN